jgi:hypothetical protein
MQHRAAPPRYRLCLSPRTAAVSLLAVCTLACTTPPDPRRTNFEIRGKDGVAKYDPKTGRLSRLDIDHNKDGSLETFSYWDGARVLRIEVDSDGDGRIERWEHYDSNNQLIKVGSSRRDDGTEDTWSYPNQDGQLARVDTDTDRDGAIDKRETFITSTLNPSSRVLSTVELDIDRNGLAGRRLHYSSDGMFMRAEVLR